MLSYLLTGILTILTTTTIVYQHIYSCFRIWYLWIGDFRKWLFRGCGKIRIKLEVNVGTPKVAFFILFYYYVCHFKENHKHQASSRLAQIHVKIEEEKKQNKPLPSGSYTWQPAAIFSVCWQHLHLPSIQTFGWYFATKLLCFISVEMELKKRRCKHSSLRMDTMYNHRLIIICHTVITLLLTLFESSDPPLTTIIVWGKNVEVKVVVKNLWRHLDSRKKVYILVIYNCVLYQAHLERVLIVAWYLNITTHNLHALDFVECNATFHHGFFLKETLQPFLI